MPHMLKQDREYTLSLKLGKRFPHKAVNPVLAARTLYLLVRKCSRPKAHSYGAELGLKNCT